MIWTTWNQLKVFWVPGSFIQPRPLWGIRVLSRIKSHLFSKFVPPPPPPKELKMKDYDGVKANSPDKILNLHAIKDCNLFLAIVDLPKILLNGAWIALFLTYVQDATWNKIMIWKSQTLIFYFTFSIGFLVKHYHIFLKGGMHHSFNINDFCKYMIKISIGPLENLTNYEECTVSSF